MKREYLLYVFLLAAVNARSVRDIKEDAEEPQVQCAPVQCGPQCREAIGKEGCSTCLCGPLCSPPKCDPGCTVKSDPSLGPCPECVCDDNQLGNLNISEVPRLLLTSIKCQCDKRYFKHYETKNCTPIFEEGCDCPIRYECPEVLPPKDVCEYKGKTYQVNEAIETSSSCEICSCRDNFIYGVQISCIPIECPSVFRPPIQENCYEVYEEGKCCSVNVKCVDPEAEVQGNITEPVCEHGGKTYHFGQRIYPQEDHCMICMCDENWTGINGNSCHIHECLLERKLGELNRGCIPIYHEKTCCPIEFYCGTGVSAADLNETLSSKSDDGCMFEGTSYAVGEELDIKHPTNCVKCTCQTPPDFTCVHISCPRPPNHDYVNCRSIYKKGECCPTYDCVESLVSYTCDPVKCVNGCKEVYGPNGCSLCQCDQILCTPPKCPEACEIEYDVPQGSCPRCKCPITMQLAPVQCSPVKCDGHCFEATGPDGCSMCLCGPLCSPVKCDEGCIYKKDVSEGQCPYCLCPENRDHALDTQDVQCAPVKCPPACREVEGQFGCPMCLCDPLCSPPNCPPGCEIERVPSSGPCPGCACDVQPNHNVQCAPVKCAPTCHEAIGDFGCSTCVCDPMCPLPKCKSGCELELIPSSGPCPWCVCKDTDITPTDIQCAPVKCGPTCREATGEFGCPICLCDPLCSPPKCDPGCEVESVPSSGPCPGCVCGDQKNAGGIQCAPVKCDQPTCRETIDRFGCSVCLCGPLCAPPKCDPGCEIETVPSSGPCPGCVCPEKKNMDGIQCAPVKCPPTCREAVGQFGCPVCLCDPLCSPPKCDPGCEVESVPSSGPCPGCVCPDRKGDEVQCAPVKCGPTCREAIGQFGCPMCLCDPLCSPPKCDPGCEIEKVPSSGPCPGCVCPQKSEQSRSRRDLWDGYYIYV